MPIAPPVPTRPSSFSAIRALGPRFLPEAGRELLWTDGHGAAPHPLRDTFIDQHFEVAAHGHLADVELVRELGDEDATFGVEALAHDLQSFDRLTFTGRPPPGRRASSARGCRLVHAEREALHERVAERGRFGRTGGHGRPVRRRSASR